MAKIKGEGYPQKANRIFTMLVQFGLIIGVVLGVLLAVAAPTVSRWLGADEPMMDECVQYIRFSMIGMPGFVLQCAFQSFYMAAERPQLGTLMSVVAGVINIVLDAILVWGLGLGVTGAAIATSAGCMVGGIYPIYYFSSNRSGGGLNNKGSLTIISTRFIWPYIWKACSNGLSEYVDNIAMNIVTICYNLQLMHYIGENGVSAYGVLMYLAFIFAAVFIGYNIGITPIIGYNYGAGNIDELRSIMHRSTILIGVLGILMTLSSELFARPLARVFVGYDAVLTELTVKALRLYMLAFLISGWNMFVSALFTGLNNGIVSAVAAFTRTLVFEMACVWLLPTLFGIDGIWVAWPIAESLSLLFCIFLIFKYAPQLIRKKIGSHQ